LEEINEKKCASRLVILTYKEAHIVHLPQQCHNSKYVIFSGETCKGFEVL
jgi:hypothetical protein